MRGRDRPLRRGRHTARVTAGAPARGAAAQSGPQTNRRPPRRETRPISLSACPRVQACGRRDPEGRRARRCERRPALLPTALGKRAPQGCSEDRPVSAVAGPVGRARARAAATGAGFPLRARAAPSSHAVCSGSRTSIGDRSSPARQAISRLRAGSRADGLARHTNGRRRRGGRSRRRHVEAIVVVRPAVGEQAQPGGGADLEQRQRLRERGQQR